MLNGKIEIFADIEMLIFEQENVDMDHVCIDGTRSQPTPTNTAGYGKRAARKIDICKDNRTVKWDK